MIILESSKHLQCTASWKVEVPTFPKGFTVYQSQRNNVQVEYMVPYNVSECVLSQSEIYGAFMQIEKH